MALNCFDVVRPDQRGDLLLVYQNDFLSSLDTRLAIPLLSLTIREFHPVARLNPIFEIEGQRYILWPQGTVSVAVSKLGRLYGSLEHERDAIRDAFDFLTTGF